MLEEILAESKPAARPLRLVPLVLALALAAGGIFWWTRLRPAATAAPQYTAVPVTRGDVATSINATGPVSTSASIPLTFKSSGQIAEILVGPGDHVKAGQVLAREDTPDLQHALDQAKASLAQQQAALAKLQQGATPETLAAKRTAIANAQAALDQATKNVGVVDASNDAALAKAQHAVAQAQTALADAQKNLATTEAQLKASAQSDATSAQAAQTALTSAQKALRAAQAQVAAKTAGDQHAVDAAQAALATAQQGLRNAQAAAQAAQVTSAQQIVQAKDSLHAQQITRDAACNPSNPQAQCQAAQAQVEAAQTGVDAAQAQAAQAQVQQAQAITQAQAGVNQAQASLKAAQDALAATLAQNQGSINTAQAQVDQDTVALKAAQQTAQTNAAHNAQTLASAQAQVHQAQAALQQAQDGLATTAAQNASNVAQARVAVEQAQAQLRTAQQDYNVAAAPPTQADLDSARAQVQSAQVAVQQAQENLDAASLRAPIDATVSQVNGSVGQFVTGGTSTSGTSTNSSTSSNAFIVLNDLQSLQVVAQVNEADMARLQIGDPVQFTINAFPGQTFTGTVVTIQPLGTNSNNVVTYGVTCSINPTTTRLLPGMTASVSIATDRRTNVVTVPQAAVAYAQARGITAPGSPPAATAAQSPTPAAPGVAAPAAAPSPATVVVLQGGKPTPVWVLLGLSDGEHVEVVSGLQPGQQVVTASTGGQVPSQQATGAGSPATATPVATQTPQRKG